MGVKELEVGGIRRDFAVVPLSDTNLAKRILNALTVDNGEYLQLEKKPNHILTARNVQLFEQGNVKASRKQILPIIQKVLNTTEYSGEL